MTENQVDHSTPVFENAKPVKIKVKPQVPLGELAAPLLEKYAKR